MAARDRGDAVSSRLPVGEAVVPVVVPQAQQFGTTGISVVSGPPVPWTVRPGRSSPSARVKALHSACR